MNKYRKFQDIVSRASGATNDGAVSATITVNLRSRAADFRNASTVRECPIVKTISLWCILNRGPQLDCARLLTQNVYDPERS